MTERKATLPVLIMLSVLLFTCEEIIEFEKENQGGELVIFGRFTDGRQGNSVSVRLTSPVDRPPDPISRADVYIYNETGDREQFEETDEPGVYRPREITLPRIPGQKYYLEVCTPNGKNYRSEIQELRRASGRDSIYFRIENNVVVTSSNIEITETSVNVFLDSDISENSGEPVFLRWEVEEVYSIQEAQLPASKFPFYRWNTCYITNPVDAQRFLLFNGLELTTDRITGFALASRVIDDTFAGKHYFNVVRYSMNFETFDHWQNVSQLTDRVGSIFDAPPAALLSNIRNTEDPGERVLGYFEVVASDTSRFLVGPGDLPLAFDPLCKLPLDFDERVPAGCFSCVQEIFATKSECLNCLKLKNSSLVRPDYF